MCDYHTTAINILYASTFNIQYLLFLSMPNLDLP